MSHDIIQKPAVTDSQRTVTKSRVIVGLLGEVDAAGVLVLFAGKQNDTRFAARIQCEFKVPFDTSILKVQGTVTPGVYAASALFAGQRLTFDLNILDENGQSVLPSEIKISDLRRQKRRKFGPEIEYAEVFTKHGVLMATPLDMSQNSIALIMQSTEGKLVSGETVRLVIRGDTTGQDIFTADLEVKEFQVQGSATKILLGPGNPRSDISGGALRLTSRYPLSQVGFLLGPLDDHLGEPVHCRVTDISLTGFQCVVPGAAMIAWMMPGTHVSVKDKNLTATVIWCDGDYVGLRIDALDQSACLKSWTDALVAHKLGNGFHHAQVDELINLFTESGLLKGRRRQLYGRGAAGYLPSDNMTQNPLLYHRLVSSSDSGKIGGHISMARLSDELWCIQEGSHAGEGGRSYGDLYADTVTLARSLYYSTKLAPRYLSGLYHASIKSAGAIGQELFADPSSRVFPLFQTSISKNLKSGINDSADVLTALESLDADTRRQVLSLFDASLVEGFAGWNGTHPRLNAELAKLGPHHEAKTMLIGRVQSPWGLAYRLRSYYALNATGVMNSLFMIVLPTATAEQVIAGLKALVDHGLAFGTDDAAIIIATRNGSPAAFLGGLVDPKPFTFFMIDNHLNREFLGANIETESTRALRRKRE